MDGNEPCADKVDELVEEVGVGDAVYRGIDSEEEEKNVGDIAEAVNNVSKGISSISVRLIEPE